MTNKRKIKKIIKYIYKNNVRGNKIPTINTVSIFIEISHKINKSKRINIRHIINSIYNMQNYRNYQKLTFNIK